MLLTSIACICYTPLAAKTAKGETMSLWIYWFTAISNLRPAFSRTRTFLWFIVAVAGLAVRTDLLGVTSIVRALKLHPRFYNKLLEHFHSPGVKLDLLAAL